MSTFLELYGAALDRELGSADRTVLFTTARRQQAINDAQRAWVRETECLVREGSVEVAQEVAEYDLESRFSDFWWLAPRGVVLVQDDGTDQTYLTGEDFPQRQVEWLDRYEPGWRQAPAGTPTCWYPRTDDGRLFLGLSPAPDIPADELWSLTVAYVAQPTDLSADTDEPFSINDNPAAHLRAWHPALVHYAAAQLELLRRDRQAYDLQLSRWAQWVVDYLQRYRPRGGQTVEFARDYRGEARRHTGTPDWRSWP